MWTTFDALFDDQASLSVEGACDVFPPAINGNVQPDDELAAFSGKDVNGTWTITITDQAFADTGALLSWAIVASLNDASALTTPSPTDTPSGPPTNTPVPTSTPFGPPTDTPSPTNTPSGPTNTPGSLATPTSTDVPQRPTLTPTPMETSTPVALPDSRGNGDVTCDGETDTLDALFVLWLAAGMIDTLPCPNGADVNFDGVVNSLDAALILQYRAGFIESLPV